MRVDGVAIHLPPNPMPYIIDWLMEIGPVTAGGMGSTPLAWSDIAAWQDLTGINMTAWEARTIRRLSRDFHDQLHRSKEPTCPAPYTEAAISHDAVTEQFKRMFRVMAANRKK